MIMNNAALKLFFSFIAIFLPFQVMVAPAQATLTLDASLFVGESYTNNLFFTFANKRDDFGTFVTPRLTLQYESESVVIAGTYTGIGQFYVNNPGANTFINGADLFFDLPFLTKRFDRLEIKLNESFNITPQLPAFSSIASGQNFVGGNFGGTGFGPGLGGGLGGGIGPGVGGGAVGGAGVGPGAGVGLAGNSLNNQGVLTNRASTAFQNRAGFRAVYHFTQAFSQSLEYTNQIQEFTTSQFQDSITHIVDTQLERQMNPRWSMNLGYTFQRIDFQGSGIANSQAPGGSGNGTSHTGNVGTYYQFSPTVPLTAQMGITYTNTELQADRVNFTGDVGVSKNFQDGNLEFRYNQQIGNGGGLAATTTLNQTVFVSANKSVTEYVSLFGTFGFARNASLTGQAIRLTTFQGNAGVSVAILSWLSGIGSYSYQNQESSGTFGNTAQSHNILIGLTATAPSWRLFR